MWIEKTLTGIECKVCSSEVKPIGQQLKCFSIEILDGLKKYIRAGAKHLIVVTNLVQDDASELYDLLMQSIGSECRSLKVVRNSIPDIIRMTSEVAEAAREVKVDCS